MSLRWGRRGASEALLQAKFLGCDDVPVRGGDYRQVLKERGKATLFVCDIPFSLISGETLLEFSGMALEYIFKELLDIEAVTGLDRMAVGLKRLRFRATTVRERGRAGNDGASLTIQAAGELLELKWEVVAHLVNRGLLQAVDGLVPGTALKTFEENYVTGAELARCLRTSPRALAITLEREGVLPATGPSVDGSRQNFYRRCQTAHLL